MISKSAANATTTKQYYLRMPHDRAEYINYHIIDIQ